MEEADDDDVRGECPDPGLRSDERRLKLPTMDSGHSGHRQAERQGCWQQIVSRSSVKETFPRR